MLPGVSSLYSLYIQCFFCLHLFFIRSSKNYALNEPVKLHIMASIKRFLSILIFTPSRITNFHCVTHAATSANSMLNTVIIIISIENISKVFAFVARL